MALTTNVQGIDLVAVLLITRSRPGPKLVFHYPARPAYQAVAQPIKDYTIDSDSDSEGEGREVPSQSPPGNTSASNASHPSKLNVHGKESSPVDHVFGHPVEALEKLFSPGRWSDRKKFEVQLDGLAFVGHPVYSSEDGSWSETSESDIKTPSHPRATFKEYEDLTTADHAPTERLGHDFTHIPESLDSQADFGLGASTDSNSTASAAAVEQMAMFHVVFALRKSEHTDVNTHITTIYQDVAKKLSKALHYCQKQSNYVASESQKLLSMLAKSKQRHVSFDDLWTELAENSELAWALKELYHYISDNKLATIRLSGMEISLRANSDHTSKDGHLSPFSALLLLETKDSLLRSLSHPDASPLAHFIREHTPTKNLLKHSTNLSMPLSDILYLAHHLLKWRKARLIAPLHQRNTYIVHPSLALADLPHRLEAYHRSFPTLPSLPHMLKVLSGKPIKYGLLIPTRDHRGPYMDILAFLVRHDLVTLLQTFGWLRLPSATSSGKPLPRTPRVSRASPPKRRTRPVTQNGGGSGGSPNLLSPHLRPSILPPPAAIAAITADDDNLSIASDRTAIPTAKSLKRLSIRSPASDSSRPQTASRDKSTEAREEKKASYTADRNESKEPKHRSQSKQSQEEKEPSPSSPLLLNPTHPTPEERRSLTAMKRLLLDRRTSRHDDDTDDDREGDGTDDHDDSIDGGGSNDSHDSGDDDEEEEEEEDDDAIRVATDLHENVDALLPFLDGRHAFEGIAARLQVKRARVEEWIGELERRGWVLTVRHD